MFIERLVALGQAFINCGMGPDEVLKLIADVEEEGRFLENVAVVEVALDGGFKAARLPLQTWGDYEEASPTSKKSRKKKARFDPDFSRGLGVPFIRPRSGNPTVPQGKYGVPVYPIFPGMLEELAESASNFLRRRLERTLFLPRPFSKAEVEVLAGHVKAFAGEILRKVADGGNQGYGLIVLCIPSSDGPYRYDTQRPVPGDRQSVWIGESVLFPGRHIIGNLPVLAERFKLSKTEEGAEMGKASHCSICGREESESVSAYSKAWPWLAPTWHPPFPERFKEGNEVTDIAATVGALCPDCYTAMVVGAGVFKEVSGILPQWLTRELFLPVASAGGREEAKKGGQLPAITGSVVVLPLQQDRQDDAGLLQEALDIYRRKKEPRAGRADRMLQAITGFEGCLPEELNTDDYRLSMVYYTQANADIQLRAMIEDVLPSVVARLQDILLDALQAGALIRQELGFQIPDWAGERYCSLPYLLIRAYGGCYLWQTLADILHCGSISWDRFVAGAAARMSGYAKSLVLGQGNSARQSYQSLKEEVYFYLIFRFLYHAYNEQILRGGEELSDWREMRQKIAVVEPEHIAFSDPEELGFAAGYLVRRFGRQYYAKLQKDFLRHRVMSFGSSLTPDDIWRRALSRFQEYALKLDLGLPEDFRRRAAVVECEYRRLREAVQKHKDEFIGAFWSGYMLALPSDEDGHNENQTQTGRED